MFNIGGKELERLKPKRSFQIYNSRFLKLHSKRDYASIDLN